VRILYLGPPSGTSAQRAHALERTGHEVVVLNPDAYTPKSKHLHKINYESGGLLFGPSVSKLVLAEARSQERGKPFDLVWVNHGRNVSGKLVAELKARYGGVLNINLDDPFGGRDRFSWATYLRALPKYDLVIVLRAPNVAEAQRRGAKRVIREYFCADEVAHHPRTVEPAEAEKWGSEVQFVGTWMPERGTFLTELADRGVPLAIWGDRWNRAPEWRYLEPYWRGAALHDADSYAKVIQCSKISIGLLSKGNRDLHTTRSLEIPSLGGLLCGERTSEHSAMYEEGHEALFWDTPQECAEICIDVLSDEPRRRRIATAGQVRFQKNGYRNELLVDRILKSLSRQTTSLVGKDYANASTAS
jgi:hypothetical protein